MPPVSIEALPTLPAPARLERRPSFVPASASVAESSLTLGRKRLAVEIAGVPTEFVPTAGVAIFETGFGVMASWLPLDQAQRNEGRYVFATQAPDTDLRITCAANEKTAARGYWAAIDVPADRDPTATITLSSPVQTVRVHIVTNPIKHGQLMHVRRVDDVRWRPHSAFTTSARTTVASNLDLVLGPGTYELVPWSSGEWIPVLLRVPGPNEITARFDRQ